MTEIVSLHLPIEPESADANPAIAALVEFDRFEDLEKEAISRIAVSIVFGAIEESAWIEA